MYGRITRACPDCPFAGGLFEIFIGNQHFTTRKGICKCPSRGNRAIALSWQNQGSFKDEFLCSDFDDTVANVLSAIAALTGAVLALVGFFGISMRTGPLVILLYLSYFVLALGSFAEHLSGQMFGMFLFQRFAWVLWVSVMIAALMDDLETSLCTPCMKRCPRCNCCGGLLVPIVYVIQTASFASFDLTVYYGVFISYGFIAFLQLLVWFTKSDICTPFGRLQVQRSLINRIFFIMGFFAVPTCVFWAFSWQCFEFGTFAIASRALLYIFHGLWAHWATAFVHYTRGSVFSKNEANRDTTMSLRFYPSFMNRLCYATCCMGSKRDERGCGFFVRVLPSDTDYDPEDWFRKAAQYKAQKNDIEMAEADDANDAPALPDDAAKVEESEAEAEAANGDGNTAAAAAAAAAVAVPSLQLDDANDASKKSRKSSKSPRRSPRKSPRSKTPVGGGNEGEGELVPLDDDKKAAAEAAAEADAAANAEEDK